MSNKLYLEINPKYFEHLLNNGEIVEYSWDSDNIITIGNSDKTVFHLAFSNYMVVFNKKINYYSAESIKPLK